MVIFLKYCGFKVSAILHLLRLNKATLIFYKKKKKKENLKKRHPRCSQRDT